MTVKEMHIGIDVGVQKLNSNVFRNLDPQEKDWWLNAAVYKFINNRINNKTNSTQQGYQKVQKRYDDIETLLTSKSLTAYKIDDITVYGLLPYNYFHLDSDSSQVYFNCINVVGKYTESADIIYQTQIEFVRDLNSPAYVDFKIDYTDTNAVVTNLFDSSNYPSLATGLTNEEERFQLIDFIISEINRVHGNIVDIYWETFNETFYTNSFIVIGKNSTFNGATLDMIYKNSPLVAYNSNFTLVNFTKFSFTATPVKYPNRLTSTEIVEEINRNSFSTTRYDSPLSIIHNGKLVVYRNNKFILNNIIIRYIRKPRVISLSLNQSCELNPNVHKEIVNIACELILGDLNAATYKNKVSENMIQE